jgi:hypothetical protein
LAMFRTFFLLLLDATALTERGIVKLFLVRGESAS